MPSFHKGDDMKNNTYRFWPLLGALFAITAVLPGLASADGTETLGPPAGITIAKGTGIIAAGVGLEDTTPSVEKKIAFTLPADAVVKQVLFYWEGQTPEGGPVDVDFKLNGIPVAASDPGNNTDDLDRICAPVFFYTTNSGDVLYSLAYRYDITPLNLVGPGDNSIVVTELDGFGFVNDGAGVLVIFEQPGKPQTHIDIRDGNDLAFRNFPSPRDATVPQEFAFASSDKPRQATLSMFFSSVAGLISGFGADRPSSIEVTVAGVTTKFSNLLNSNSGQEWDTQNIQFMVPAGATSLTVQAFSRNDYSKEQLPLPASFFWLAAGLSIAERPPESGQGCTPGYWKQTHHFGNWPAPYTPETMFSTVFENAFPGKTLLQVLQQGGGGLIALGRHTVAALLNGGSDYVNFDLSDAEVISRFNDVYPGTKGAYQALHTMFANYNERYCPLGRASRMEDVIYRGLDPNRVGMLQNYPNPFNPTTQIAFSIPEGTAVTLRVYNMLGQAVRTLTDGYLEAGLHSVEWDARSDNGSQLPSGIYIYKLQAGTYTEVRKMTLMR
jgi:hypothetical protein